MSDNGRKAAGGCLGGCLGMSIMIMIIIAGIFGIANFLISLF